MYGRPPKPCGVDIGLGSGLKCKRSADEHTRAFTILELLVGVGLVALLAAIMLPSLSAARHYAKSVTCRSNISQIILANDYYADDNDGVYFPGAAAFTLNLHRWHGTRNSPNEGFDPRTGPLMPYLGPDGSIRQCPALFTEENGLDLGGFERGNGGYGYNNAYIGVQLAKTGDKCMILTDLAGTWKSRVRRPVETIMFTDSAFAGKRLMEYSFAEPRFHIQYPEFRMDPSIHFRHGEMANVGWCDGHVDAHRRTLTWSSGIYRADPDRLNIGWFGKLDDNSLFDLD